MVGYRTWRRAGHSAGSRANLSPLLALAAAGVVADAVVDNGAAGAAPARVLQAFNSVAAAIAKAKMPF